MESHSSQEQSQLKESVEKIQTLLGAITAANGDKETLNGLEILLKLMANILKDPSQEKFRIIKTTIPKIQSTLFSLNGGIDQLLKTLGYVQTDAEHYAFVGDYFAVLKRGQALTEKAVEPIRVKFMTPDERKKYDILQEQKRLVVEEQKKKQEMIKQFQKMQEQDRKEKSTEEVKSSVANKLTYGANIVKFTPPEPRKGG